MSKFKSSPTMCSTSEHVYSPFTRASTLSARQSVRPVSLHDHFIPLVPYLMPYCVLVGGLVISRTEDLLTPFYVAMAGHIFYFIVTFFFIPESLSKQKMVLTMERRKAEHEAREDLARSPHPARARLERRVKSLFGFMGPLAVFAPVKKLTHGGTIQRDWNLTYIAGSAACVSLLLVSVFSGISVFNDRIHSFQGSTQFKFQYAAALFNWSSEEARFSARFAKYSGLTSIVHKDGLLDFCY